MTRKLKLLILSLLGFSAACSGVKNSQKSRPDEQVDSMSTVVRPDIRLMYGVRRPVPVAEVDSLKAADGAKAKVDTMQTRSADNRRAVTMYGVRVPMQNIDLDSLKRAEQERQQKQSENAQPIDKVNQNKQ